MAKLAKGTKVHWGDGGAASVAASLTHGTGNQKIVFTAVAAGAGGNSITVTITNGALAVSAVGNAISIAASTSTDTINNVIAACYASAAVRALVDVTNGDGDGTGLITVKTETALSGGTNSAEVFADLPGVGDITLDPGSYSRMDVTSHSSPGPQPEMINEAFTSEGTISFSLNWDQTDTGHLALEADFESNTQRNAKVQPPAGGGTTRTFVAQVMSLSEAYPVKGVITRDVQIGILGSITKV